MGAGKTSLRRASILALEEDICSILHAFVEVFQLGFSGNLPSPRPETDPGNKNPQG
jgi:hypothetical protein